MTFKQGDYVKDISMPKGLVLHLKEKWMADVVNDQKEKFRYSTAEEHAECWGEDNV